MSAGLDALSRLIVTPAGAAEPAPAVFARYSTGHDQAFAALQAHATRIDVLLPDWLVLKDAQGRLAETPAASQDTRDYLDQLEAGPQIAPVLAGNADQLSRLRDAIASPAARRRLVSGLVNHIRANGYAGVTLSIAQIDSEQAGAYTTFARQLKAAFAAAGLAVYHMVPVHADPGRAADLADHADAIIITGDASAEAAGALAPQAWYARQAERWARAIPSGKLVFNLPNYALDWRADRSPGETISVLEALARARDHGAVPALDPKTLNTRFNYTATDGSSHTVWMLDAVTAFNQLHALTPLHPRGVMVHLGFEDPGVWPLLSGKRSPDTVEPITAPYFIRDRGVGESITVTGTPAPGRRSVAVAADSGLIESAEVTQFPQSYEISRIDAVRENQVALTFDDGPHAEFTPQILDVLSRYGVRASFFATGDNMLEHPHLIERIVAEGHEVGSHTYSHVNISAVSPDVVKLELNTTQRIFESITGRNMALFRAPYAADTNPRTPEEIGPLKQISDMGYLSVNMNIDPKDWKQPGTDLIVERVIEGVMSGHGNIVLLHDAGGDRSQTVDALPQIIETLRARGYTFLPVSELIGRTRAAAMPKADGASPIHRRFEAAGFAVLREGRRVLGWLFVLAVGLGAARAVMLMSLAAIHPRRPAHHGRPGVGVVVPAYNEEKVILNTVNSLLASTYPDLRIIVVDDGSSDGTYALCRRAFANEPRVSVVTQKNAGKAAALNHGFELLDTEIVVALDADTVFLPDTIGWLVRGFGDPRIDAVAGNAKVGNRRNMMTRWQALEYITAQNLDRRAFDLLNAITVVPGAVGAWRRSAVLAAGGFATDTLAEDADLTIRLLRNGGRVVYAPRAVALTEAPQITGQFIKQRFRWMFGMLQVAFKHRGAMRLKDSKPVGLVALPNIILFQIMFPLIAPAADLVTLGIITDLGIRLATNSEMLDFAGPAVFLLLFFAFLLLDALAAVSAFRHERDEDWKLLLWIIPQRFFYRQLIYLVAIRATLTAIRGSMVGWGNLVRSATVAPPEHQPGSPTRNR